MSLRQIATTVKGMSKSSVVRQKTVPKKKPTKAKKKPGRPSKLSLRDKRKVVRCLQELRNTEGFFTSDRLMEYAGISKTQISGSAFRKFLNSQGYYFMIARQKGILSAQDRHLRLQFAKNTRRNHPVDIWTKGIAFYLDGVSFVHKRRPKDQAVTPKKRVWRRKNEGLKAGCLAKGRMEGTGAASVVRFVVAISYQKGVIICERYDKMNGKYFADFIKRNFIKMYGDADKDDVDYFLQDGDPSQNSKIAKAAMKSVKAEIFAIPPRSADLNPIENIFAMVNSALKKEARTIEYETRDEFVERVKRTLMSIPIETIDKTILSMDRRLELIIKNKGERIKY